MTATTTDTDSRMRILAPIVFTATIFLSASLLFFVQPLFSKIVLPHIGGAPAVWTTAMLFFQSALLAGYVYTHFLTRHLSVRSQMAVHFVLWALALLFLPLAVAEGWRYDASASTVWQTLVLFAGGVGIPFAVLSANAPLIQTWYARTDGPSANDPYFLYGASNLGSLLALLAFPLIAEPVLGVTAIGMLWAYGFVILGAMLMASGFFATNKAAQEQAASRPQALAPKQIAYWAVLAFLPSSLMLAVTTKISTDLGALPLIWVIPLALYLLTFVIGFTNRWALGPRWQHLLALVAVIYLALTFSGSFGSRFGLSHAVAMVAAFFVIAYVAHRRLYDARPDGGNLTIFYVTMSVGGALGGLFNSIIAPNLFSSLLEGSITTIAAAAVLLLGGLLSDRKALARIGAAAATAAVILGGLVYIKGSSRPDFLFKDRSFFGVHSVHDFDGYRVYANGTTVHGMQRLDELDADRPTPQKYYHPNGPMAEAVTSAKAHDRAAIGIVGLGVGALTCYAKDGQDWHLYEIDQMVDDVARDPELFTFMTACGADMPTHMGDARIVLERQDLAFDVLVIDAYSSDSVPVHLTTVEAVQSYIDRLKDDGIVLFHISNRFYAIDRPLGRIAKALGLTALIQPYPGNLDEDPGDTPSIVVAMARNSADLQPLKVSGRWMELPSDGGPLWTDDYANPLSILYR